MPEDFADGKSRLIQLMARCRQATSEYSSTSTWIRVDQDLHQVDTMITNDLWPLLLTWFNFNPSMDK